jgi:hypothetical protein
MRVGDDRIRRVVGSFDLGAGAELAPVVRGQPLAELSGRGGLQVVRIGYHCSQEDVLHHVEQLKRGAEAAGQHPGVRKSRIRRSAEVGRDEDARVHAAYPFCTGPFAHLVPLAGPCFLLQKERRPSALRGNIHAGEKCFG